MKTLIIEDEPPAAARLKRLLTSINPAIDIIEVCNSVSSSVAWLNNNPAPELILSDIELADGRSFEIFNKTSITSPVIFVTAYDEFAIKAIKLNALDYLLKPVKKEELEEALQKVKKHVPNSLHELSGLQQLALGMASGKKPKKLAINTLESTLFVPLDNIIRMEADSNYTHIYLADKKQLTASRTLKEYEELLSNLGFFRVNKKFLINLSFIDRVLKADGGYVLMSDGSTVEISPTRRKELLDIMALS